MTAPRLTSLQAVTGPAARPGYTPAAHGVGIVHIGFGAFHRAHQAVMTDEALAADGGDWRIAGVSLRSKELAEALNAQNGLYTLIERGAAGAKARVIGAVDHVIAADSAATLEALCDPMVRVVTLTVTEKGYGIDLATHAPDLTNATVAADLKSPDAPQGVLGLLVAAIKARRAAGHLPFTVLSCDNLPENGVLVRDGVIGFAKELGDHVLADWIATEIAFPSSMVDRITPAVASNTLADAERQTGCIDLAAIETEPFTQWVIEDTFPSGRPAWEAGGALFVPDVTPYEQMKLTMLNGSHSMLAYAGFLTGKPFVRDVMADQELPILVHRHLRAAANHLSPLPGVVFSDYSDALAERFCNPAIAHETYQIAADGTQKLPQRIFQPALKAVDTGGDLRPFAFATAMWMRYCLGEHDDGSRYDLRDPRTAELVSLVESVDQTARDLTEAFHALPNFIPAKLAASAPWRDHLIDVLSVTLKEGCVAAVRKEATQHALAPA